MRTSGGRDVAPVIDVYPDLCGLPYTAQAIRRKFELLAGYGFRRVYLVAPPPGYPMFSNPWMDLMAADNPVGNHALESLLTMGDPLFEHLYEAHRQGLEAFAIVKPYEGGGGYTVPHGQQRLFRSRSLPCLGGERVGFDALLREHAELRVRRRPSPRYEELMARPLTTLRLLFCLDRLEDRTGPDEHRVYDAQPDDIVTRHPAEPKLWLSGDNGTYVPYDGPMEVRERVVGTVLCDANGRPLADGPRRCREVLLTGLSLGPEVRYLAVTLGAPLAQLVTLPWSMVTALSDGEELPITVTPWIRSRCGEGRGDEAFAMSYPFRGDQRPSEVAEFARNGFEFDWYGAGFWGDGWLRANCLGIARGKLPYLKGTPCEAYPEVRESWLEQVRKLLAMGFDGIDLRLQSHSAMVSDYAAYGFNEPLVVAYREEYGVDPLTDAFDPLAMMRVRGRFYGRFVEQAAGLVRAAGKTLQLHLHHCDAAPRLSHAFGELGFWAMPKVLPDWEAMVALADEVTIKDYHFGRYDPARSAAIKARAAELGKPVWVHCYLAQGNDLTPEFFAAVHADAMVTGILLYELGHNPYAHNPWVGLIEVREHGEVVVNPEIHERLVAVLDGE